MMKKALMVASCTLLSTSLMAQWQYPETQQQNISDDYFGTKVADPYRWLENDTSAATAAWVKSQQDFTEKYLEQIPYRQKIKDRLSEIWNYPRYSKPTKEGDFYVYYKNSGLQNQAVLYIQKGLNGKEEILLDPNEFSTDGTVALQNVRFSTNQKYLGYSVSASGSDWQEIYVMDMKSRKLTKDKISHVKFTGIAWVGDEGFYYSGYEKPKDEKTKYSAKTENQKIFYHKLGTSQDEDILIYEEKDHPLRYVSAGLTEDQRYLVIYISEGTDGNEIKVKDLSKDGPLVTIVPGFNTNAQIIDNDGENLLLLTNHEAPNYKLLSLNPNNLEAKDRWKTIIPEGKEPLGSVTRGGGKLFAQYLKDATSYIVQYNLDGTGKKVIDLPGIGSISGFGAKNKDQDFYYTFTSFTTPAEIYHFDIKSGKSKLYRQSDIKFNSADYETKQVFATSPDGTQVPMFITHKKGLKLDGNNPTMLYAYGGFNISLTPSFSVANTVFLEQGGIYVLANLRGGSEYGESWHRGGMLENKQNVFDDFIACATYLIQHKYTSPRKLAIRGGSNGGLLVGACMTQRPELFAVAIPQVGVLDMLRYHKFTVGWGWAVEYGTSEHKDQFDYLIKYSPLHNVRPDVCYPATLITTADHDDRVVPAHSFKFAAELQKHQQCDRPTLIRIDAKAGHGAGKPTSKQIEEAADITSFIFWNTNHPAFK